MKVIFNKKWKWLGVDSDGGIFFYLKKPKLESLYGQTFWNENCNKYKSLSEFEYIKVDVANELSLYKRVGSNWVKQKFKKRDK